MDKVKKLFLGNLNLVLAIVGVFVLLISYLVGYQNLSTLNTEMNSKLSERSSYLTQLKEYYGNIAKYKASVTTAKGNIAKNLSRLSNGIKEEDFLLYLMNANKEIGGNLSSVSFTDPEKILDFETMINDKSTAVSGFRTSTTSTSTMTYDQLKRFLAYVYDGSKAITYVDSVSITYNGESATLNTVWNLSKFFITYENSEYKPIPAPEVALGKKNLFGTK